jgi:hypothetical protein
VISQAGAMDINLKENYLQKETHGIELKPKKS